MKKEEVILILRHKLQPYLHHKKSCNLEQDWTEAQQAMGDTPEKFRDESWHLAYNEMREKMQTCTCGANDIIESIVDELESLQEDKISDEDKVILGEPDKLNFLKQRSNEDIEKWAEETKLLDWVIHSKMDALIIGAKAYRDGQIPKHSK
jgi:vacuolar-type H+-ATPase subunit H